MSSGLRGPSLKPRVEKGACRGVPSTDLAGVYEYMPGYDEINWVMYPAIARLNMAVLCCWQIESERPENRMGLLGFGLAGLCATRRQISACRGHGGQWAPETRAWRTPTLIHGDEIHFLALLFALLVEMMKQSLTTQPRHFFLYPCTKTATGWQVA